MLGLASTFLLLSSILGGAVALPAPVAVAEDIHKRDDSVTVTAPAGSIVGIKLNGTESFTNIPYAEPAERLRAPVRRSQPLVNYDASHQTVACPQFLYISDPAGYVEKVSQATNFTFGQAPVNSSEDCLNLLVLRPSGTKEGDKLPVFFWIHGGGYMSGSTSDNDGNLLISESAKFGKPMVYVSINYRLAAWGFMGGKEVLADGATNLGSLDQRMALEWVADNIAAFGGDPDKVTIGGVSAGAFSVWNQLSMYDGDNTYKGKPLFRGAIMTSGSIVPSEPVDGPKAQEIFDAVVSNSSCAGNNDTVNCLRQLPSDEFTSAANSVSPLFSYTSMAMSYMARPDGKVFTASPEVLLKTNRYAKVPMIVGTEEDEGTLFSDFQSNGLVNYFSSVFYRNAGQKLVTKLVNTYPQSVSAGSPYGTGSKNELYPGYKRVTAMIGDLLFILTRRITLENAVKLNPEVPAWSYIGSFNNQIPYIGTFHGSDLTQLYYGIVPNYASKRLQSYYANFVYNVDPNNACGGTSTESKVDYHWPRWFPNTKDLIRFYDDHFTGMKDTFRSNSANVFAKNIDKFYI